jgi:GGDEF domain-containing protein
LLCRVAERIQTIVRGQESVYRLGCDEFAVIIEQSNDIHTTTTAKDILQVNELPSYHLELKITEGTVMDSPPMR